ncbi:4Fe-4S binding domain protein [Clostridioides difficile CD45]|nr:4Fe-4S binding domain protein [Clostridioides difficile CD45]SJQ31495.1 NADH-plastoquinone oxidoreductase subunit [Clostridioides difficile]SJV52292.1 4Fe-4S ferredoxin iron-sulfur binding domain-containing protein [Clostridioides difficile]
MTICFYSGTGNSYFIAKFISEFFKNVKLVSISENFNKNITLTDDVIGIVFPVHGQGIPPVVFKFLCNTKFLEIKYSFSIASYGGVSGKALEMIDTAFQYNDIKLHYIKKIRMPANCVIAYPVLQLVLQLSTKSMEGIQKKLNRICCDIQVYKKNNFSSSLGRESFDSLLRFIQTKEIKYSERGELFYSNSKCIKCLKCVKLCPVGNVMIENQKIVFGTLCIQCMACINWCPVKAINWRHKTEKRNRYTNPKIEYNEMISVNKTLLE